MKPLLLAGSVAALVFALLARRERRVLRDAIRLAYTDGVLA